LVCAGSVYGCLYRDKASAVCLCAFRAPLHTSLQHCQNNGVIARSQNVLLAVQNALRYVVDLQYGVLAGCWYTSIPDCVLGGMISSIHKRVGEWVS
jgi:hypothetical protein